MFTMECTPQRVYCGHLINDQDTCPPSSKLSTVTSSLSN